MFTRLFVCLQDWKVCSARAISKSSKKALFDFESFAKNLLSFPWTFIISSYWFDIQSLFLPSTSIECIPDGTMDCIINNVKSCDCNKPQWFHKQLLGYIWHGRHLKMTSLFFNLFLKYSIFAKSRSLSPDFLELKSSAFCFDLFEEFELMTKFLISN